APRISQGVLQGQASLIDGKRRLIASHAIGIERPAPAPDAAGGVQALVEASEELGRQLAGWLSEDRGQMTEDSNICGRFASGN
ncbi:MAG: hypothetical protein LBQ81_09900, partial [Zoogloeaceae bacterium]|nr:hypothetical protein [Zoogloeaceae bacterium]